MDGANDGAGISNAVGEGEVDGTGKGISMPKKAATDAPIEKKIIS